ncbi:hypothetical protein [Nocardia xishanensis]
MTDLEFDACEASAVLAAPAVASTPLHRHAGRLQKALSTFGRTDPYPRLRIRGIGA